MNGKQWSTWLYIAMNDSMAVRIVKSLKQLENIKLNIGFQKRLKVASKVHWIYMFKDECWCLDKS